MSENFFYVLISICKDGKFLNAFKKPQPQKSIIIQLFRAKF